MFLRQAQDRLLLRRSVKRYASEPTPCGCQVARPSSWSRDSNS
ncbi:MAG: hypothetical protein WBF29_05855 [Syntrophobacteria bacterium]